MDATAYEGHTLLNYDNDINMFDLLYKSIYFILLPEPPTPPTTITYIVKITSISNTLLIFLFNVQISVQYYVMFCLDVGTMMIDIWFVGV